MTTPTASLATSSENSQPVAGAGLAPCPFCTSEKCVVSHDTSSDHRYDWDYRVACTFCGACGASDKSEAEAIATWNRRMALPVGAEEKVTPAITDAALLGAFNACETVIDGLHEVVRLTLGDEAMPSLQAAPMQPNPFAWAVRGTILPREQWVLCFASDPGDVDYVEHARKYRYEGKSVHEVLDLFSAPQLETTTAPVDAVEIAARVFDFKSHKQTDATKTKLRLFASEVRATAGADAALSRAVYNLINSYQSGMYDEKTAMFKLIRTVNDLQSTAPEVAVAADEVGHLTRELRKAQTLHFNYKYEVSRIARQEPAICNFPETDEVRTLVDGLYEQLLAADSASDANRPAEEDAGR